MKKLLAIMVIIALAMPVWSHAAYAGGGSKKKAEGEGPVVTYMELDPLLLPIIDDQGISQQVSLIVKLEIPDAEKAEKIQTIMPKILDAFVQDLYGSLSNQNAMLTNGILRLDKIKTRLKITADKVAGDDMITDVLLQVVQQHKV